MAGVTARGGFWGAGRRAVPLVALVVAGACGGKASSESEPPPDAVCRHGGATYRPGDTFQDDCNTCSCGSDGLIACTAMACGPTCELNGVLYPVGASFPAPDGCNTCSCDVTGQVGCTQIGCGGGCTYDGRQYAVGESFPDLDECNTCICGAPGQVVCTQVACPPSDCTYLGQTHVPGERFPARDGCNSCECYADGRVACTEIACPCKPDAEWWRDYVALSPGSCAAIDFGCPAATTHFQNECGCGCEQDASCPEYTECGPAGGCVRCPFSRLIPPNP